MYQRARKLAALNTTNEQTQYFALAEQQLEALVISSNALSLLDQKDPWIILPVGPEGQQGARQPEPKRRKLTKHIPEDRFASGKRDLEIVKLTDVIAEHTLLSAQLDLVRKDPELFRAIGERRTTHTENEVLIVTNSNSTLSGIRRLTIGPKQSFQFGDGHRPYPRGRLDRSILASD